MDRRKKGILRVDETKEANYNAKQSKGKVNRKVEGTKKQKENKHISKVLR